MSKLTITLDNDPTIYLDDQDLSTLSSSTVLDQNYKGVEGHLAKLDFGNLLANDYDPQAEATALQNQIDALSAKLAPLQTQAATQAKLQPAPLVP